MLLDAGMPVHVVAARCGHDPAVLLRTYAKRTRKADTSAAETIAKLSTAWRCAALSLEGRPGGIVKLCLVTSQLVGEVAGIVAAEINLKAREWRLPGSRTKNGHPHVIPLSDLAIEARAWVQCPAKGSDEKNAFTLQNQRTYLVHRFAPDRNASRLKPTVNRLVAGSNPARGAKPSQIQRRRPRRPQRRGAIG